MYKALSVARHIIDYCNDRGCGISNLKLQKVLYFVQAEFLVSTPDHSPCFSDTIEAWDFGPVVPSVYHRYKLYGGAIIPSNKNDLFLPFYEKISVRDQTKINSMVDTTEKYTASQLVEFTHNQAPWKKAYARGRNNPISNDMIRSYFENS